MGINNPLYKAATFGVSALYTGIAGALGAIVLQFVAPAVLRSICPSHFSSAWLSAEWVGCQVHSSEPPLFFLFPTSRSTSPKASRAPRTG